MLFYRDDFHVGSVGTAELSNVVMLSDDPDQHNGDKKVTGVHITTWSTRMQKTVIAIIHRCQFLQHGFAPWAVG